MQEYLTKERLTSFIQAAFQEDVGEGDHSTLAAVPADQPGKAQLLIKEPGVIAGLELAKMIFHFHDPELQVETQVADGQTVGPGQIGFWVTGKAASILTTERLVLNCMQRMSGIATKTKAMHALIQHTNARLLDTRKTTPNFRMLEKWAVSIGGGKNHRFALYDMIMLKDNHIDFAGGISRAITAAKTYLQREELDLKIEIETRSLDEVREVMRVGGVDIIMLDNMDVPTMKEAVRMIGGRYETEASGGIDEQRIVPIAESGVDYISVGALTHHVKSLDISLKAVRSPQQTAD
ncbi:nicotinate-nucleotide pyrophosphorylase [carboxylating] [Cyclobacterium xiamenense]|uniref:Probable nicotinate-nucleotide pyrophosphorylase [carboxylating] n=1 Tax=Cyclobacterium xiamenense TaxID=1297121 RepID=A0A1H6XT03_9BACT|nr:carboxylating nicotinate-nucleotide diphosphorylase [Cyclobacterium xiamenense]SEJ32171.1 nicotinate-nucleotide pyrophosphorylase [carboxylating] [Cyclobacterium xiamenense]